MKNPTMYRARLLGVLVCVCVLLASTFSVADQALNVYWGDLHGHSTVSDGDPTPAKYFLYGRRAAKLDFLALTDHSCDISAAEWTQVQQAAEQHDVPGTFVSLIGYEWSDKNKGHRTVLLPTLSSGPAYGDPYYQQYLGQWQNIQCPQENFVSYEEFWTKVLAQDGIVDAAHPTLGSNFDWNYHNGGVELLAEIVRGLHRYKACYGPVQFVRACIAHSPDGIHWTAYNNNQPVTGRASDTYNQILWDEAAKTYRLLTRSDYHGPNGEEVRGSRVMVNADVKADPAAWKTVRQWRFEREGPNEFRRRQIYGMTDWIYEGIHFGLMMVYEWPKEGPGNMKLKTEGVDYHKRHDRDVMNFYIAPCRDGANWDLQWVYAEKPLVPRGPDGSFDKDMIVQASNIVTWRDKHWIYYTGYRERHWHIPRKPSIGLATLPLDRFVGLQAGKQTGSVTTKPFRLDGGRLLLNVDAGSGSIAVEVLSSDDTPVEGFSAKQCRMDNVDELRLEPKWESKRKFKKLQGQTVRLRFYMENATLYTFQIQI